MRKFVAKVQAVISLGRATLSPTAHIAMRLDFAKMGAGAMFLGDLVPHLIEEKITKYERHPARQRSFSNVSQTKGDIFRKTTRYRVKIDRQVLARCGEKVE